MNKKKAGEKESLEKRWGREGGGKGEVGIDDVITISAHETCASNLSSSGSCVV